MKADGLIGVDIGTQGTKTVLFDRSGHALASAFRASGLIQPAPGQVYEEPDDLYISVTATIREVMDKAAFAPGQIAAIGIDGQMAGVLGVDQNWQAVTPYDSWLDTRCEPYIRRMKREAEAKILSVSGCPVTYDHGPKILWWQQEQPEIYRRIRKFVQPAAYVAGRLAGLTADQAFIDYTYLHFSGFGDIARLCWSPDLLAAFAVDPDKMPDIVKPWDVVGRLTPQAAADCGLSSGTLLVAGCGDQAATALGAGITQAGQAFDVAGTASVFSCCVDHYAPDLANQTLLYPRSVIEGLWQPMAYINGGGLCLRWLRDQFGETDYDNLNRMADSVAPGCSGLLFQPHFNGRVCPNQPDQRGSFIGLSFANQRGELYRAVLEAIACEYGIFLQALRQNLPDVQISAVHVIGGGARSGVFNQIKADVLGLPYMSLQTGDTGPLGAALVAGYGVGLIDDLSRAAAGLNRVQDNWQPNANRHRFYQEHLQRYQTALQAMNDLYLKIRR